MARPRRKRPRERTRLFISTPEGRRLDFNANARAVAALANVYERTANPVDAWTAISFLATTTDMPLPDSIAAYLQHVARNIQQLAFHQTPPKRDVAKFIAKAFGFGTGSGNPLMQAARMRHDRTLIDAIERERARCSKLEAAFAVVAEKHSQETCPFCGGHRIAPSTIKQVWLRRPRNR